MFNALFRRRKKTSSASIAKERLQIIVAHERNQNVPSKQQPDFLNALQKDILEVVRKYMPIDSDQIKVAVDKEDGCDVLELNIVLLEPEENAEGPANQETDATQQESSAVPVVESNETR